MVRFYTIISVVVGATLLAACDTPPDKSGFLGDYSGLEPSPNIAGAKLYLKDENVLNRFDKVMIDPISVVVAAESEYRGVSPLELKEITDYFRNSLILALGDAYPVVDEPGEGVLRMRSAITGVRPQPRPTAFVGTPDTFVQSKLRNAAASTFSPVETALEAEFLDSLTGVRVAAFTDRRVGGELPPPDGTPSWDFVADALDFWAASLRRGLDESRNPG